MEFCEYSLPLRRIHVAIYSAEDDTFFVEELAHKIQAPFPEGEDYTSDAISNGQAIAVSLIYLLS